MAWNLLAQSAAADHMLIAAARESSIMGVNGNGGRLMRVFAFLLATTMAAFAAGDTGVLLVGDASSVNPFSNTWALWDAEGQYLTTDEILAVMRDYGAGVYFFREETRHGLDLGRLKSAGMVCIKVAHPGYGPFKSPAFLSDEGAVRAWAREALESPSIDGVALDIEGPTATTHKDVLRWLGEEARARDKTVHAVPHFALFDRWAGTLTPAEFNALADVVWPWLYNRFRRKEYGEGVLAMLEYWRDKGVSVPTYPIIDHGRESYSGIMPDEAAEVPTQLHAAGVETVCLFQPHASYRARESTPAFHALWSGLANFEKARDDK